MSKYIFVTGGVMPGSGKGTTAAALGRILKNRGLSVAMLNFNPYLNVDPGTMSPYQHGEVFVTEDGAETDLDIGHYERFLDAQFSKGCSVSAGKLYSTVINNERLGKYVGSTVQTIPHVSDEVKKLIRKQTETGADIIITQIGGSLLDYEVGVYLNALREFILEEGNENVFVLNVDFLPYIEVMGQERIESMQQSIKVLNSHGIVVDAIVCRTPKEINLDESMKKRIARRCSLNDASKVIANPDVDVVYKLPIILEKEGLDTLILNKFRLSAIPSDLSAWKNMVKNFEGNSQEIRVCIVGKYTKVKDAYISIVEAVRHACAYNQVDAKIEIVDAEDVEEYGVEKYLKGVKAIIVPPGWGNRGFDGMVKAVQYARENKIPYLGIGFGMQIAAIEIARNVLGLKNANSTEIDPNVDTPVIDVMASQKKSILQNKVMRLGAFNCVLDFNSISYKLYGNEFISERHRHKYEFNNTYFDLFDKAGVVFAGMNPETKLTEIIELKNHPFFICTIFQPEFKSYPNKPHPLYLGLINTAKSVR